MNKSDLIARIAEELGRPKTETEAFVNSLIGQIGKALGAGESVVLPGFGTFETRSRAARTGRNPQTGATIEIPAGYSVKVSAGSKLKAAAK